MHVRENRGVRRGSHQAYTTRSFSRIQGTDPAATLRNVRHGSMKDRRRGPRPVSAILLFVWRNNFFNWTFDRSGLLNTKHLRHDLRQRSRFAEISCGRGRIDLLLGY